MKRGEIKFIHTLTTEWKEGRRREATFQASVDRDGTDCLQRQ